MKQANIFGSGRTLILPVLLATVLRVVYWWAASDEPWFQTPGMDPEFYSEWSKSILAGEGGKWLPFPRGPLYVYLLAGLNLLFGDNWLVPRLFNLVCDLVTIWIVWLLAGRIDRRAAFWAAMLAALSGAGIYYSGEILMTSLETMLAALFLLALVRALDSITLTDAALAGLMAGLFSLCRPNALLLIIISPVALYLSLRLRRINIRPTAKPAFVCLIAGLMTIAPATYFNYKATGRIVPVATQGGVNFFIGNARGATGWASILPGVGADWTDADAERLAELDAGTPLTSYESSQRLWSMGLREIAADPGGWIGLSFRKLLMLFNFREIGNNRPLSLPVESFPVFRLLFALSLGTMIPLALLGISRIHRDRSLAITLGGFLVLFGGSLLLFFITTRYRMPLLPPVSILAGVGLLELPYLWKAKSGLRSLILLLAGALLVFPPWAGSTFDDEAQGYFVTGNALLKQGKTVEAAEFYRRAETVEPGYPKLHLNWGAALLAAGDSLAAEAKFKQELSYRPDEPEALNNLGIVTEGRGDYRLAREYYSSAIASAFGSADAKANLFRLELKWGDNAFQQGFPDSALAHYQGAEVLGPDDPRPTYRIALVQASTGQIEEARKSAIRALSFQPDYLPAKQLLTALPPTE